MAQDDVSHSKSFYLRSLDLFWTYFGFILDNHKLQQTQEIYQFGAFRLDPSERLLEHDDEPISLSPKQFDLLFYFVENAGRVAKKSELLDAVWTDTYIEESTLARNVSWLRNKLGEFAGGELLIETVPKIGYRFTAKVKRSERDENALIVEEQTVQFIRGEETITFEEGAPVRPTDDEKKFVRLPSISSSPRRPVVSSLFIFAAIAIVALAGSGFLYWNKQKSVALPAESNAGAAINRSAVTERIQIKIGWLFICRTVTRTTARISMPGERCGASPSLSKSRPKRCSFQLTTIRTAIMVRGVGKSFPRTGKAAASRLKSATEFI